MGTARINSVRDSWLRHRTSHELLTVGYENGLQLDDVYDLYIKVNSVPPELPFKLPICRFLSKLGYLLSSPLKGVPK